MLTSRMVDRRIRMYLVKAETIKLEIVACSKLRGKRKGRLAWNQDIVSVWINLYR
jgi:hypothetical protein